MIFLTGGDSFPDAELQDPADRAAGAGVHTAEAAERRRDKRTPALSAAAPWIR